MKPSAGSSPDTSEEIRGLVDERNGVTEMLNGRQRCIVWPSLVGPRVPGRPLPDPEVVLAAVAVGMTGCLSLE